MVNADADGEGLLARDASLLELGEREAATATDLGVVLVGRAADNRAQQAGRGARGDLSELLYSSNRAGGGTWRA